MKEFNEKDMLTWDYKGLKVYYYDELDGDGTSQASSFVTFIKNSKGKYKCKNLFEWCAGPGFIGFALLKENICDRLYLADINPIAIKCIEKTIKENNLYGKVEYYLSDNFKNIPVSCKFDLVVANPPNYYELNINHRDYEWLKDDLRPNDKGWKIHGEFYSNVKRYLSKNAYMLIEEVEPFEKEVNIPVTGNTPFDIRPEAPIEVFKKMIFNGGLTYIETKQFHIDKIEGIKLYLMISQNRI